MATANFPKPNLNHYYTIFFENSDIVDFEYESEIDNIKELLKKIKGFEEVYEDKFINNERVIGKFNFIYFDRDYREWSELNIYVVVKIGYYDGIMIDVNLDELENASYSSTVEKKINRKLNQVEKILAKNTIVLRRVATFSNGETIYQQVNFKS